MHHKCYIIVVLEGFPSILAMFLTPTAVCVRSDVQVPAVYALLAASAQVDKQTLAALRQISEVPVRQLIEAKFQEAVNRGECSPLLKNLKERERFRSSLRAMEVSVVFSMVFGHFLDVFQYFQ